VTRLGEYLPIERLFPLDSFLIITAMVQIFGYFFHVSGYVFILAKSRLGYILSDFFTNSSGHPVQSPVHKSLDDNLFGLL
jgi:E3 ubiquitin-protein ligase DOA10